MSKKSLKVTYTEDNVLKLTVHSPVPFKLHKNSVTIDHELDFDAATKLIKQLVDGLGMFPR
jgi:hypothetical protein